MKRHDLLSLLLLLVVALMVGCAPTAATTDEPDVTDEPVETEAPEETEAPAEETEAPEATDAPTEAASALPETVTIGVAFGLSGDIAVYGESQQNGVEL